MIIPAAGPARRSAAGMRIVDHHLQGDAVRAQRSPNDGGPFAAGAPDTLILHYTALDGVDEAVRVLSDPTPGARVSAHVVVGRDGAVTQLLPFDRVGWHAGVSAWGGRQGFNHFSLGLEIDNLGRLETRDGRLCSWHGVEVPRSDAVRAVHANDEAPAWWHRYPAAQLIAVEQLSRLLVSAYGLGWILGHDEIAPQRKIDPGPAFPLTALRARLLGAPLAAGAAAQLDPERLL